MNRLKAVKELFAIPLRRVSIAVLCLLALGACNTVRPDASPRAAVYALEGNIGIAPITTAAATGNGAQPGNAVQQQQAPTLIINPPHAAAGFDSPHIIYIRAPGRIEYFAQNEWVDTPARMLAPLLVAAISGSGAFRAVALTPSAASADLRLDTEIIRLQQEFLGQPSRVRFTLRAYLVNDKTRRVLAWREFESVMPASGEDPHSGVLAASQAVQAVLADLAAFSAAAARNAPIDK